MGLAVGVGVVLLAEFAAANVAPCGDVGPSLGTAPIENLCARSRSAPRSPPPRPRARARAAPVPSASGPLSLSLLVGYYGGRTFFALPPIPQLFVGVLRIEGKMLHSPTWNSPVRALLPLILLALIACARQKVDPTSRCSFFEPVFMVVPRQNRN
jgi:hypothetical protein